MHLESLGKKGFYMKKCTVCKVDKVLNDFSISKGRSYARCKECAREYARKYHHTNKEKCNTNRKKYYQEHREDCIKSQKEYYKKNKNKIRDNVRERNQKPENKVKNRIRAMKWANRNKDKLSHYSGQYKKKNPEKANAHQYVMWALRLNVLSKPENCERCKLKVRLEAHHEDYSKPLEIKWLCKICHMHEHDKLLDLDPRIENDISSTRQYLNSNST